MKTSEFARQLGKLLEIGIHCNLALILNEDVLTEARIIEEYLDSQCSKNDHKNLIEMIDAYLYSHHCDSSQSWEPENLHLLKLRNPLLIQLAHELKRKLKVSWPFQMLLSDWRTDIQPEILLNAYDDAYRLTNGFESENVDNQQAEDIITRLSKLQAAIENDDLIYRRACLDHQDSKSMESKNPDAIGPVKRSVLNNINLNSYDIFYDRKKTSFRQALVILRAKHDENIFSSFEIFKLRKITEYGGLISALVYKDSYPDDDYPKERYFDELTKKQYAFTYKGFSDGRTLKRGLKALGDIEEKVSRFYEVNTDDLDREFHSNAGIDIPRNEFKDLTSAVNKIKSEVSLVIKYHVYILANKEFIKGLRSLRDKIIISIDNSNDIGLILNELGRSVESHYDREVMMYINDHFKNDIDNLRSYSFGSVFWSYFCMEEQIPSIMDVIKYLNEIRKETNGDYDSITHNIARIENNESPISIYQILDQHLPKLQIIPSPMIAKSYQNNRTRIVCSSNLGGELECINQTIDFLDNQLKPKFLASLIINNSWKKLESTLWGLNYHLENNLKEKRMSKSLCMRAIEKACGNNVSNKRFDSGINDVNKYVKTFLSQGGF